MSEIVFDFTPNTGPVQQVVVHSSDPGLFDQLVDCAEGREPADQIVRIADCTPDGAERREWMFRAGRISNVRWVS